MRYDSKTLPENIRKCMPAELRKEMKVPTIEETQEKAARGEELKLHRDFENWCLLNQVPYVHSRTDKKSTIASGWPDFTILYDGRGCCIEFKATGGCLSNDQKEVIPKLKRKGVPTLVTCSLAEAIRFATEKLDLCQ